MSSFEELSSAIGLRSSRENSVDNGRERSNYSSVPSNLPTNPTLDKLRPPLQGYKFFADKFYSSISENSNKNKNFVDGNKKEVRKLQILKNINKAMAKY